MKREVPIEVRYKGDVVGAFQADMVVASRVVVEIKATRSLVDLDRHQLLNYLRATELELGLLLEFGHRAAFHKHRRLGSDDATAERSRGWSRAR